MLVTEVTCTSWIPTPLIFSFVLTSLKANKLQICFKPQLVYHTVGHGVSACPLVRLLLLTFYVVINNSSSNNKHDDAL